MSGESDGKDAVRGTHDPALEERASALVGKVIADRYRIHNVLATGGMGVVYTGEHVHMRKRVAIKVLHPDTEGLPGLVARFEREAIVGAHVEHKNVASARDFGKMEDGSHYLVLEFVRGITLRQILRHGRMPLARVIRIAKQVLIALSKVHAKGIVHRDINPRNVMVIPGPKDLVKLIDFGFAKVPVERFNAMSFQKGTPVAPSQITGDGIIFGTIGYLAPEAALGMRHVDHRSDLYAVGAILYEMLSGVPPFEADTQAALFLQHRIEPVPKMPENDGISVPPPLEAIAHRLLAKTQPERFQKAEEVIRALDAAAADLDGDTLMVDVVEAEPISLSVAGAQAPRSLPRYEDVAEGTPQPPGTSDQTTDEKGTPPAIEAPPPATRSPKTKAGKEKGGSSWLFVLAFLALGGAGVYFAFRAGWLGGSKPTPTTAATTKPSATSPTAAATTTAEPAKSAAAASAATPPPLPTPTVTAVAGLDAEAWKRIVKQAPATRDFAKASEGVRALAELDPTSLGGADMRAAVVEVVVTAAADRAQGAVLTKALAERFGPDGVDVLYDLVATRGGSQAAILATPFLQNQEVRARGSEALRVALELRDAKCEDKPNVLDKVRQSGDERSLAILSAMRSPDCDASSGACCMRENPAVETAARELQERLKNK
ncbi:MAG: serine/threonine protein kinase [Polyangiaceae bacterium]|nr:serine/threonine protein kinase [Polyangiaceae bacterium]